MLNSPLRASAGPPAAAAPATEASGLDRDPGGALTALLATGMAPWDAMVALLGAEAADPSDFPALQEVPKELLVPMSPGRAIEAFETFALSHPQRANAALAAFLAGRTVDGDLGVAHMRWVTSLPAHLTVTGDLELRESGITALPERLAVGGHVLFHGAKITTLPDDLEVGGNLILIHSNLAVVPERLRVGGALSLQDTLVAAIPKGLRAHDLYLGDSRAKDLVLPDGLALAGRLDLANTPIASLPGHLAVGELNLLGCLRWNGWIPDSAQVGKRIFTDGHPDGVGLEEWRRRHPYGEDTPGRYGPTP
jgi:hypothetical protein